MSVLMSPIDGAPMRKVERYGVELDVCTRTGGVWLDKGELEKILAITRESDSSEDDERNRAQGYEFADEDDDDVPRRKHRRSSSRRSRLLDIFDF